jgi:hypothetical protein
MRDAGLQGPLVTGADADEHADRDRAHRFDRLGDDAEPARECRLLVHGPEPT